MRDAVAIVVAPGGRLVVMLAVTIRGDRIVEIDVVADPERLRQLDLAVIGDVPVREQSTKPAS